VAGQYRLLVEAYSISETRLVASAGHLSAVATLLEDGPERIHAIAALARAALESSARVAWLLDLHLDGRTRGLRSLAELMYVSREESKMPSPAFQDKASARLKELLEGAEASGFEPVRNRKGQVMHFGEQRPDATDVIRWLTGDFGELVYRELSGVAHGNLTAHARLTEPVPADEQPGITLTDMGMVLHRLAPLTRIAPQLGIVWAAFSKALWNKVILYGWDRIRVRAWTTEAGRLIGEDAELEGPM
jgi:hypothetical protein